MGAFGNSLRGDTAANKITLGSGTLVDLGLPGATIQTQGDFIASNPSEQILERLTQTIEWEQRDVVVHGNTYPQPRLVAWYGTGAYSYSGMRLEPKPLTPLLRKLQDRVEAATGKTYNSVLLNRYVAGQLHGIGHHSDNEPELGRDPTIAMLTFGEGRELEFKPKKWLLEKHPELTTQAVPTPAGSLLVMSGATQRNWIHGVPKKKGQRDRITLTFRTIS